MNYLAHILLSGDDPDWQLGGLLGDFIKGPLPALLPDAAGHLWPSRVRAGVLLHRQLDAHLDQHPLYRQSLELLGPEHRRPGGIALDVFFDHLLVQHWSRFSDQSLAPFCQRFYRLCEQQQARLPPPAARFMARAAASDLFGRYGRQEVFMQVLERIEGRLRFALDLQGSGRVVLARYEPLEEQFLQLMPRLQVTAGQWRTQLMAAGQS